MNDEKQLEKLHNARLRTMNDANETRRDPSNNYDVELKPTEAQWDKILYLTHEIIINSWISINYSSHENWNNFIYQLVNQESCEVRSSGFLVETKNHAAFYWNRRLRWGDGQKLRLNLWINDFEFGHTIITDITNQWKKKHLIK
jgi:hypothetical protein